MGTVGGGPAEAAVAGADGSARREAAALRIRAPPRASASLEQVTQNRSPIPKRGNGGIPPSSPGSLWARMTVRVHAVCLRNAPAEAAAAS